MARLFVVSNEFPDTAMLADRSCHNAGHCWQEEMRRKVQHERPADPYRCEDEDVRGGGEVQTITSANSYRE